MSAPFALVRRRPHRPLLDVQLIGDLDVATVRFALRELPEATDAATLDAWIDLRQVTSCPVEARGALVALHQRVVGLTRRRAYLASRAAIRGVALWVLHVSPDPMGRVLLNEASAERWLQRTEDRLTQAEDGLDQCLAVAGAARG
ncbi:MAG: hypothetical protein KTR31_28000 [Myxococcales bacterium]|nr:hypothetical protein [Myxococcales bacterium]